MGTSDPCQPKRVLGRYALYDEIAAGGMATVHFARLIGPVGFSRTVAVKRLHPQFAKDPEFAAMFLDEARVAGRIRHPNVVPTLDVVATDGELFLVMEYVQGDSLSRLFRAARAQSSSIAPTHAAAIMVAVLDGLHAAHEAKTEQGQPLEIVHRDVSPQNILVGIDGVARVLDFGVAKAAGRLQTTKDGQLKGKLAYMAPEQINGHAITRATDIYAATAVLWECICNRRLFAGDNDAMTLAKVLVGQVEPPTSIVPGLPTGIDELVVRGLHRDPGKRFATAREMARALEKMFPLVAPSELGEWVENLAASTLALRAERIAEIESSSSTARFPVAPPHPAPVPVAEPAPAPEAAPLDIPVTTQITSGSFSGTGPVVIRPKRRGLAMVTLALAVIALVVVVVIGVRRKQDKLLVSPAAAAVTTTSTVPSTAVAPQAPSTAPAESAPAHAVASASTAPSAPIAKVVVPSVKPAAPAAPASSRKGVNFGSVLDSRK